MYVVLSVDNYNFTVILHQNLQACMHNKVLNLKMAQMLLTAIVLVAVLVMYTTAAPLAIKVREVSAEEAAEQQLVPIYTCSHVFVPGGTGEVELFCYFYYVYCTYYVDANGVEQSVCF